MTLVEFKRIFLFEYSHRLLGRALGVVFALPFLYFLVRRRISWKLAPRLGIMFVLGALQGVLGWYMVKSGLVDRPDVSQYRLAAHLGLALAILAAMIWVALDLIRPEPQAAVSQTGLRRGAWGLLALISVTALSGAFVAGLDAGHRYNTFPLMDGRLIPEGVFDLSPVYLNFFENIATVQFDHRILAISVLVLVGGFWWRAGGAQLTGGQRRAVNALAAVAVVQVGLGISTLVLVVPIPLAALHQAGAVTLLGVAVWLAHEFRPPRQEKAPPVKSPASKKGVLT